MFIITFNTFFLLKKNVLSTYRERRTELLIHVHRLPSNSIDKLRHPSVRRLHSSNIFTETTGPVKAKFHVGPATKICSNGPGLVTKMAAMPIYDKNSLNISETSRQFGIQHQGMVSYKVCSNDTCNPVLTLTYFTAKSNSLHNAKFTLLQF